MPVYEPITAPPNRSPSTGLLARAVPQQGAEGLRWQAGFTFAPETCDPGILLSGACQADGAPEKPVPDNLPLVRYLPVVAVGSDACTTFDQFRDREARARRHLRSIESYLLERAFWTGEAAGDPAPSGDDTEVRPHLADGTATVVPTGGAAVDPVTGIALLDQALTECLHGQTGMVHVTPRLLVNLVHLRLVLWAGDRWLTPNGHTIVAGSGYTGGGPRPTPGDPLPTAPDLLANPATAEWAYATPQVYVLTGEDQTLTDIDRSINTETVRVERPLAAFHGCCKFTAQIQPVEV